MVGPAYIGGAVGMIGSHTGSWSAPTCRQVQTKAEDEAKKAAEEAKAKARADDKKAREEAEKARIQQKELEAKVCSPVIEHGPSTSALNCSADALSAASFLTICEHSSTPR